MAWVLSAVMLITPTARTLAGSFDDAATEGQAYGRDIVPDPYELFRSDGEGSYKIFPDNGKPLNITPEELWGRGAGNAEDLKDLKRLWGDDEAIQQQTSDTQERLKNEASEYAEAYRALTSSMHRAHPDLSSDPIWDSSRHVMEDIFTGTGPFNACEVTREVTEDGITTHLPDYRTCNLVVPVAGSCAIHHDYKAGVIEHAAGPMNIKSCGAGCRALWLGRVGDNYWNHEYYNIHTQTMQVRVIQPDAITSVVLEDAWWDDHMQVWIDGAKVWWNHNRNFPPDHASCDDDLYGHGSPGLDVTSYFKNVAPGSIVTIKTRVLVCDRGEGYARLRVHFDSTEKITKDVWHISNECQAAIKAIESGFASGGYTCTNMPPATNGCISIDETTICESDLASSPVPGTSSLCREVRVEADLDFNEGGMSCWADPQGNQHCPTNDGDVTNTCAALASNPDCRFIESQCIESASDAAGNCYAYTVRYDCGEPVEIPTASVESTYTCPGGIRCMGEECVTTSAESNHDFARAAAALQAADYMAMDMSCPVDGHHNIRPDTCKVFAGEASECKTAVGGAVDCCKKPGSGVSLAQYITLLEKSRKAAMVVLGEGGALHGAWTKLTGPITDAWSSVTSYFASALDANTASTPVRMMGVEGLKQMAMKQTAQFLVDSFGAKTASMFFTNGTGSLVNASGQVTGTLQLGGAVGTALSVVMWSYTAYVVAMLVIQIVWKCEKSELALGVKRKLKSAHYVGSYCATDVMDVCIEERRAYCTFNSPLSRMLQEQMRAQLGIGWGSSEDPNCRGLTVAEINRVNWEHINLDEWLAILQTTGHMPSSPAAAMGAYSMGELTEDVPMLNADGTREDTLERNQQRLQGDATLHRNEERRQRLWGRGGGE